MEITAVIEGLKCLKEPCCVDVYSDSAYTVNAFEKNQSLNTVDFRYYSRSTYRKKNYTAYIGKN